jgi:cellulose synthase/poly-beta-1,6-N-acetylglucosamine synthase-like glycosyltransferase
MVVSVLLAVYGLCVGLLALYALGQAVLLMQYLRRRGRQPDAPPPADWPLVCVQLPIYNEQHIALRLLEAVTGLDYPRERLHVQLLDDSTDGTTALLAARVNQLRAQGWKVDHLHRSTRRGYKAGALADGLRRTRAPYVAIFDADFVPPPHFLKTVLPPLLADPQVAVVQTAWGHLNAEANWLTRAQRLAVDAHFVIEQTARSRSGWIVPFNGTGGVWRAAAVRAVGGWSARTLTEDCDLSYRAQLAGWRSVYLPHVVVPGQLPETLAAYQRQQARWAQGNTQCLRLLLLRLLTEPMPLGRRLMAVHHLCQYLPQPLMLLSLLLLPPLMLSGVPLTFAPLGFIGLIPPLLYAISQQVVADHSWRRLAAVPVLILLGTGLIAQNSLAVLRGLCTNGGVFERTPKHAEAHRALGALPRRPAAVLTLACALYAALTTWVAAQHEPWMLPYAGLYALAFSLVSSAEWRIWKRFNALVPLVFALKLPYSCAPNEESLNC